MALRVVAAAAVAANTPATITVPGQQRWRLLSVLATCSRAVGGTPNRAYQLTITDGTNTIVVAPALDAGTEPGTCTVTWTDAQPASVASGTTGVSVGGLSRPTLDPGYVITATILSAATGDQWTAARAWVDETST